MGCAKFVALLIVVWLNIHKAHSTPEHIPREVWDKVKPYLLPNDHPARPVLDTLFSESRVTSSTQAIRAAGFKYVTKQGEHIKTVSHPALQGYLVKILTDTDTTFLPEWKHWIKRIDGAEMIRQCIINNQYEDMMVVPKKWIYMLPKYPFPRKEVQKIAKHFVMIVEDVNILNSRENQIAYKKKITKKHLRALFHIVSEYGLKDSCSIEKIPWTKDKKIAFINTECINTWPVNFTALTQNLEQTLRVYWQGLIDTEQFYKKIEGIIRDQDTLDLFRN